MSAPGPTVLGRWNPTVKLATLLTLGTAVLLVTDPVTPTVGWVLVLVALLVLGRVRLRTLALAHVPFLGFATSLLVVNVATRPGGAPVDLGPVTVGADGLGIGASLALRTLFVGALSLTLVLTTEPVRLMTSLHQHARLPASWTFAVLAAHRLLADLPGTWHTIRCAQAVRDPRRTPGTLPRSPRALGAAAFALLVGAVRRSERMTIALESRGLGSGPRTTSRPVPLGTADVAAAVLVLLLAAAVMVVGVHAGWVTGLGRLTA
ncbi:energy-coupling factor transporter transmembrane component T family protein [Cellulosimicrobium marinum]|uniref:energy-coupling factor transporter transmembrane component T family protein n=1 Tax=Cellulosimicrobium marinum TaxID=1638992 RepID=UPI001E55839B|nr:energy-coupling factor transporter transmembrane component T [Cellulosimicrobium marinum]MCB7137599.1 energy-coupling factor transporter transmembrane protein EcfT [Cellulosimicrobium marinum]